MTKRIKRAKKTSRELQKYKRRKQLKAFETKTANAPWRKKDFLGRFISKEDFLFGQRELRQREKEYKADKRYKAQQLLNAQREAKKRRQREFAKRERAHAKSVRSRGKLRPLYKDRVAGKLRSVGDSAKLASEQLPKPHTKRKLGRVSIQKWVYFGSDAIATAESFVLEARSQLPADTLGSIRIGTSYDSKRGEWVSTPILPLRAMHSHGRDLLSALFRLLASTSGKNVFGDEGDVEVWVEIELLR